MSDQQQGGGVSSHPFQLEPERHNRKIQAAVILLGIAVAASLLYAWAEHRSVRQLTSARDQVAASLDQTKAQVDVLTARLNALASAPPPVIVAAPVPAPARQPEAAHHRAVRNTRVAVPPPEDPRWKQVQSELADHQKLIAENQQQVQDTQRDIESTRSNLESSLKSSHDELSGSIAKTHEDVVALQRKGERNYYEFDLDKSKQFQHVGPISVSLRKANFKHDYCDFEMLVDDSRLSKKHVNLYEPVLFYPEGYQQPVELVINRIDPSRIHGYLSEPKYRPSRPAATGSTPNEPVVPHSGQAAQATASKAELDLQQRP